MGTRSLIAVMKDNEYKVAQYSQWDGYPSGQGVTVLDFIRSIENQTNLKNKLDKVRFIDADGKDKEMYDDYLDKCPEWSSDPDNRTDEQKRVSKTFWSRDVGGGILENIILSEDEEILLFNQIEFAKDSLFCEYAYVIDFDKNTFEIFEGFNKESPNDGSRFAGKEKDDSEYEAVKLIKTYMLDNLPSEDAFLKELEPAEED